MGFCCPKNTNVLKHHANSSKILLDIMKAILTSLKSLYNGQRIKAASTTRN